MFLIPYNRLTDEQKQIVTRISREQKDLFVEGPPGSGKTLISLYTLRDMISGGIIRPLLLMYNHSLYGYLRTAMKELDIIDNITIVTKDKFFWNLAKSNNIFCNKGENSYEDSYEVKYQKILSGLLECNFEQMYDVALVDEVQDLNPSEWKLIQRLSKRTTSLGDFNQGIYETKLTRDLIITESTRIEKLTQIFRFHKNIAKIANLFSRNDDNLEAKVTITSQTIPQIIMTPQIEEKAKIKEILLSLENMRQRVGVICPDKRILEDLKEYLEQEVVEYNYFENNIDFRSHDFTSTAPLLITSYSAKGLEFEHVILFGFNKSSSMVRKLRTEGRLNDVIYVSITRSNANLYIIKTEDTIDEIACIDLFSKETNTELEDDWF